jgi:hypothetical protein
MGEKGHSTNLAAEYHVLSMLYRMGADAYLTLGNKKAVDIVVHRKGKTLTIDVKGLRDRTCWPVDNWTKKSKDHFLVFVCFRGKIDDASIQPEVYIVPSLEMDKAHPEFEGKSLVYVNPKGNRRVVDRHRIIKAAKRYQDRLDYFI